MHSPRPVLVVIAALALGACTAPPAAAHPHGAASPTGARPASTGANPAAGELPGATRTGLRPPVVANGPRQGSAVSLTFDADMTDAMLQNLASGRVASYANTEVIDILERRHVPATFFLTGEWAQRYPDLTRRLAGNPRFELANHTYRHSSFVPHCYDLRPIPRDQMTRDVTQAFAVLETFGGHQTRYFRFPGGCYDETALDALAPLGVTVIQWDVVSGDAFATASRPIVEAVLAKVRPGSIIVMHVTEANARYTDDALPGVLDGLAARGLRPVTVSELLGAPRAGRPAGDREALRLRSGDSVGAGNERIPHPG